MQIIDLSLPLSPSMPCYPGDDTFALFPQHQHHHDGFLVSTLRMGLHNGTHVDAPFHYLQHGASIAELPLDRFIGPGCVLDVTAKPGEIFWSAAELAAIQPGDIVLIHTGWDRWANSPEYFSKEWPGLSLQGARQLISAGVKAIGLDTPSIDAPPALAAGAPAHLAAAQAGLPIFECLRNLNLLFNTPFLFSAPPLAIHSAEASPVRALAIKGL